MNSLQAVKKCLWCGGSSLAHISSRADGVRVLKCRNCHLIMLGEIPEAIDDHYYVEDYYNGGLNNIDTGYAETYDLMAPAFLFWQSCIVKYLATNSDKFLEIGSATGNLLDIIRENQPRLKIFGIDVSEYAVKISKLKGHEVMHGRIEKVHFEEKMDMIFSSETMEHLDDLKAFLGGVKENMKKDGAFLFYVPSVVEEHLIKEGSSYIRLSNNLEHVLHFTPDFLQKELKRFFNKKVFIKELDAGFGPFIVGLVTDDAEKLNKINILFEALDLERFDSIVDQSSSEALLVLALKFGKFEYADLILEKIKNNIVDEKQILLYEALAAYHKGQLIKSNDFLERYIKINPASNFAIKSLLANGRILNTIYEEKINQNALSEEKLFEAQNQIRELYGSRLIRAAVVSRELIGKIRRKINQKRNKLRGLHRKIIILVLPVKVRRLLKKLIVYLRYKDIPYSNTLSESEFLCSVVIPFYKKEATVFQTLDSLKLQTFQDFEIILVNDGSPDRNTASVLSEISRKFPDIIIINQINSGVAAARNKGINRAKGRYIICLDADDKLEPTYIEKMAMILEAKPELGLVTSDMKIFGVRNEIYIQEQYSSRRLLENNMVTTAAMFKKEAWAVVGGYTSGIGYEDWDFWLKLAEKGFFGIKIPESLFNYRTSISSRYTDDKANHQKNYKKIKRMHASYNTKINKLIKFKKRNNYLVDPVKTFINLNNPSSYRKNTSKELPTLMIVMPWMNMGGAENLTYSFCNEIKEKYNIVFVTLLKSDNNWEFKFREVSEDIYHLYNLFGEDKDLKREFIINYLKTRSVGVLHIVHNGNIFEDLSEIKNQVSRLNVIVTMFNDRVDFFQKAIDQAKYIDLFTTDNGKVYAEYIRLLGSRKKKLLLPNGIDTKNTFNPKNYNRNAIRKNLEIKEDEVACFFIGRLSVEKNPNVVVEVAKKIKKIKFFIVGDGPMKPQIEASTKIKKNNVRYLGYSDRIPEYLIAADIFLLPSSIEGFPLSLIEAMSMGVVSIASNVGAISDVIDEGKNGYIINPPGSVKEIVKILSSSSMNHKQLKQKGLLARETVENKFSLDVLRKNYINTYDEILKK